jgi:hypothetical protein
MTAGATDLAGAAPPPDRSAGAAAPRGHSAVAAALRLVLSDARGQSAVEVVALVPLLLGLALGLLTLLAAGRAREAAAQAAEAGAVALLHDGDPRAAACAALGHSGRCRAGVRISGRRVTVTVAPHGPVRALARALAATETAAAGPGAAP